MARFGMTVPLDGPLHRQRDYFRMLEDVGYTDIWSMEADGTDGFTPLALAAAWTEQARLGVAIAPVYTRGPALLAQTMASLAEAAPGRFVMGVGASSEAIVQRWNGIPYEEPYKRTRDTVRFLRAALTGERVAGDWTGFSVGGFRLRRVPEHPPPILVAALRSGMLRMAGRDGDGAIINWLSADDVATVAPHVRQAGGDKEIVARIFVCPSTDTDRVRQMAKFVMAGYLTVPVYAEFHRWLGRGDRLAGLWEKWGAGDRRAAPGEIPDSVVDELIVHGPPEACREHVQRYVDNGVDCPVLHVMPFGVDVAQAARDLAPA